MYMYIKPYNMYKKYKFIVYESREGMKIHYNNETTFTIFSWPEKKTNSDN